MNREYLPWAQWALVATLLILPTQAHATTVDKSDPNSLSSGEKKNVGAVTAPIFPNYGIYDLGVKDGYRVTLDSGGPLAGDTLTPCMPGVPHDGAHMLCFDPVTGSIQAVSEETPAGGEPAYRPVDLGAIAGQAVGQTQPGAMQLNVQPNKDWVYSGVPTIVYMTGEAPTSTQVVDGFNVTVTWRVREHRFEFNDPNGSDSTLTSTENGLPYPNETITWNYGGEGNTSIRVTTTWDADVSVAGVTFSLNNQHTTQSESKTFEVRKPIFSLTKTPGA